MVKDNIDFFIELMFENCEHDGLEKIIK